MDLVILKLFSNLDDSVTLISPGLLLIIEDLHTPKTASQMFEG